VPSSHTIAAVADRLYFRQLLSGRDFAVDDPLAVQMVNFVYLIGDREAGEAIAVDPAYVGGSMMGYSIQGIRDVLDREDVSIHVNQAEAEWVRRATGVSSADLVSHAGGDVLNVGAIPIQFLHTPGHTPGSQCFLVDHMLVSGDTLFLEGCGRTDLPGADAGAMYESLQRLAGLSDDTAVFPGHRYSAPSVGTMAAIKEINYVFKPKSKEAWLTMFGAA